MTHAPPAAASAPVKPNPIDTLLIAGRTFGAHLRVLLPLAAALAIAKIAILLPLFGAFGEDGIAVPIGWACSWLLLQLSAATATRLALDLRQGNPPASAIELLRRTLPWYPRVLLLWVIVSGPVIVGSRIAGIDHIAAWLVGLLLLTLPGVILGIVCLLALPALMAENLSIKATLKRSVTLANIAPLSVIVFGLAACFEFEFIAAITDTLVGRKSPFEQWLPVEAVLSSIYAPLLALMIATLYSDSVAYEPYAPTVPRVTVAAPGAAGVNTWSPMPNYAPPAPGAVPLPGYVPPPPGAAPPQL